MEININQTADRLSALNRDSERPYKMPVDHAAAYHLIGKSYKMKIEARGEKYIAGMSDKILKISHWLTSHDAKPSLMLYGTVGSGKTTMAQTVADVVTALHYSPISSERLQVIVTSAYEICRSSSENEILTPAVREAALLIVDDLGVESPTVKFYGNEVAPMAHLVAWRYDRRMATIFTSNLDDRLITERYGIRTADRLMGMCNRIAFTDESYRRR